MIFLFSDKWTKVWNRIWLYPKRLTVLFCKSYIKRGWDKSPSLSIVFGLSSKMQWLSGLYYAGFISFYSPTQLCGGGTTKSNSNEWPISVPLSSHKLFIWWVPLVIRLCKYLSGFDCFLPSLVQLFFTGFIHLGFKDLSYSMKRF